MFLKDFRRTQKLTQADIAKRVGIRQDTISKFEHNPDTTQIDTFYNIVSALNLDFHLETRDEIRKSGEWKEEW
ncbi:helix-turn-helix domain-containing protein [Ewingella allii]|uniref:helix-turn-helix domain-containing protein n=1 Tax=Ewingella allii TaxID=3092550 RepID=UPI0037A4DA47